jgi:hypothetical protein
MQLHKHFLIQNQQQYKLHVPHLINKHTECLYKNLQI